jgi:hypothetical protein
LSDTWTTFDETMLAFHEELDFNHKMHAMVPDNWLYSLTDDWF